MKSNETRDNGGRMREERGREGIERQTDRDVQTGHVKTM